MRIFPILSKRYQLTVIYFSTAMYFRSFVLKGQADPGLDKATAVAGLFGLIIYV